MKYFLLAAAVAVAMNAMAWNVATEPTAQSAIIEEFTGIHCPNCPDGHRIATELSSLHPEDVYVVSVHAGYYASPGAMEPDFRTPLSEALHDHFGINSYPCAVVNRHEGAKGTVIGRSDWGPACREIIAQTSPVNLWTESSYDIDSRTLTLTVEGYMTESMTDPRLSVFLLQNEIIGPQAGGQLGVEYPHRHMLRGRLTDADFGDPIDEKSKGEYFTRTFTYILPEEIGGIATDPVNMELLAFVSEGESDICKVSETRPDTSGLEQQFNVSVSDAPIAIGKNYAFDFFEVFLNNHGGIDATTAEFDVTINGEQRTCTWNGLLPAHTNMLVRVPFDGALDGTFDQEDTQYVIRLTSVDGHEVESRSMRGTIMEIANYPSSMKVKIKTDMDATDNTWRVLDTDGNIVKEFGPYPAGLAETYEESLELEAGKVYCLEVTDCWGDGVRRPLGSIKLYDTEDNPVVQYKEINSYGLRQFFRTQNAPSAAAMTEADNATATEYYDMQGRRVSEPTHGIYLERKVKADGRSETKKIVR